MEFHRQRTKIKGSQGRGASIRMAPVASDVTAEGDAETSGGGSPIGMEANQSLLPLAGEHGFTLEIKPHQIITVRVKGTAKL